MYIYIASSASYRTMSLAKIGSTQDPNARMTTYLTGCPPGLAPCCDITYDAIWETNATDRDQLYDYEDEVSNHFLNHRLMRARPGDSEWYRFPIGTNACEEVRAFMQDRPWVVREVPVDAIVPPPRASRHLQRQYAKNLSFIRSPQQRLAVLGQLQLPVIQAIASFVTGPQGVAGCVIAPCGSGKTVMACRGIRGAVTRCVICCPSKRIQDQWRDTLISERVFAPEDIHTVGGAGTTDPVRIREVLGGTGPCCVVSTYMSSHLLTDAITESLDLIILDEAHHMAGLVAREESGEGRTRRLVPRAAALGIRRLSLTYTPRYIIGEECLSMDDEDVFGTTIAELGIRTLINRGVLPDYRLWILREEAGKGSNSIQAKAACLLEAWQATEVVRGKEVHTLHHLIIFAPRTQEARELQFFLEEKTAGTGTVVLRVQDGDALEEPIAAFTNAPRAILINCLILNEGVDIPAANAVAITYPKQSRGQITQMVLRAGRWYEGKPIFHVLLPTLGDDDDLSGFEEVLCALASCDDQIQDEITLRARPNVHPSDPLPQRHGGTGADEPLGRIMIDESEANEEAIRRCFANIRGRLYPAKEARRIQELCHRRMVGTSVEYANLRKEIPELPEDPRPAKTLWYDYLQPDATRMPAREFVETILEPNNLRVGHEYDLWREANAPHLPSVQNICDGYFGEGYANFNALRERFGGGIAPRMRRAHTPAITQ